jgi:hypothetical protein
MVTKSSQDASMDAAESSSTPAVAARAPSVDDSQSAQAGTAANALPPALIAQAESAIYGQFEDDDMPPAERRTSRATVRQSAPKPKLK